MLPEQILARLAELEAGYPDIATRARPVGAWSPSARSGVAACLGLAAIPRAGRARVAGARASCRATATRSRTASSRPSPGSIVPAHVYRPSAPGPHPGVVHSLGHWMENARLEPDIQRFNARLARAGMLVLAYDTLGQGERRIGWHQHGQLAPLLVGFTSLGVMVAETLGGARPAGGARRRRRRSPGRRRAPPGGGFVSTFAAAARPAHRGGRDLLHPQHAPRAGARRRLRHRLGRLGRPLQPGAAARGHGLDGARARRRGAQPRDRRARDRRPALPDRGRARRRARGRGRVRGARRAAGAPQLVEVSGGHGLHAAMRDAAASALAAAFGLPAPGAEAPVALLESPYAVTHDVARAEACARADARARRPRGCPVRRCRRASTRTP